MLGLPGVSSTALPFFVGGAGVANGLRTVLFAAAVVFGRSVDSCSALCFADGALAGVVLAGVLSRSFFVGTLIRGFAMMSVSSPRRRGRAASVSRSAEYRAMSWTRYPRWMSWRMRLCQWSRLSSAPMP